MVVGIEAGHNVKLVAHLFPPHLEYLELSFTPGETTATVRTKKPLDADTLAAVSWEKTCFLRFIYGFERLKQSKE